MKNRSENLSAAWQYRSSVRAQARHEGCERKLKQYVREYLRHATLVRMWGRVRCSAHARQHTRLGFSLLFLATCALVGLVVLHFWRMVDTVNEGRMRGAGALVAVLLYGMATIELLPQVKQLVARVWFAAYSYAADRCGLELEE